MSWCGGGELSPELWFIQTHSRHLSGMKLNLRPPAVNQRMSIPVPAAFDSTLVAACEYLNDRNRFLIATRTRVYAVDLIGGDMHWVKGTEKMCLKAMVASRWPAAPNVVYLTDSDRVCAIELPVQDELAGDITPIAISTLIKLEGYPHGLVFDKPPANVNLPPSDHRPLFITAGSRIWSYRLQTGKRCVVLSRV